MYSTPPVSENHETIRLTVADILSTMANSVDAMTPTTLSLLDGLTGVPTRTTPTLTPTTLRNIEQTFMDLAANQISHEHEAGFVPPLVPSNNIPFIGSSSISSSVSSNYTVTVTTATQGSTYATQDVKQAWASQNNVPMPGPRSTSRRMSVGSNSSSNSSTTASTYTSSGNPDEVVKRKMRRERNKLAAARCRKRRLDHTMALQQEVDLWEEKKQGIQNEIRQLQKEKEELEVLLETHDSNQQCKLRRTNGRPVQQQHQHNQQLFKTAPPSALSQLKQGLAAVTTVIKKEVLQESDDSYSSESENHHNLSIPRLVPAHQQQQLPHHHEQQQQQQRIEFTKPAPRPRPTSLPVASPFSAHQPLPRTSTSSEIAGISITTPSSGIPGFNFESLMDGGTGLTPVVPSPSCSSQQMRSSALPVDLSSPEAVNRKLVSL